MSAIDPLAPTPFTPLPTATPQFGTDLTAPRAESFIPNLPEARASFVSKYQDPTYGQLPQPIFTALARFDAQRVARGQSPLSQSQTEKVLRTLLTGEAATKPRDKGGIGGFISDALGDLGTIAKGVIRIPGALAQEAQLLPTVPAELSKAISSASNPLEALSNVAAVPGVRFAPGAFIVENLDNPNELAKHPVLTALDVLPIAGRAARSTRVVKAAQAAQDVAAPGTRVRPLPTLMLNKLDNGGDLVPSRVGELVNNATSILAATRPGQLASATFGRESRTMARLANEAVEKVKAQMKAQGLDDTLIDDFAREAFEHNARFDSIPAETRTELGRIATEDPARIPDLPDEHRAYLESYRRVQDSFASRVGIASGELLAATIDGRTQIFDKATGKRVLRAQSQVHDVEQIKAWRDKLLDDTLTPDDLLADLFDRRPGNLSLTDARGKYVGDVHDKMLLTALELRGFDVTDARRAVVEGGTMTRDMIQPRRTVFEPAVAQLRTLARTNPVAAQLSAAITRGDWTTAISKAKSSTVRSLLGDDAGNFLADLMARREQAKLASRYSVYNDRVLERSRAQVSRVESRSVPATYTPLVTKQVRERLAAHVEEIAVGDPNLPQLLEAARRLDIGAIPHLNLRDFRALQRDVALTWRQMANELGAHQPIFVHKVRPSAAHKVTSPQVVPGAPAITQTRARSLDATPYVRDLSIALDHQAVEWLQKRAATEFMDTVGTTWGKSYNDIASRYRTQAVRNAQFRAAKTGVADVDTLVLDELNRLVSREWAPFQHNKLPSQATPEDLFIPKYLSDNIRRLAPEANRITSGVLDPMMGVFRTSVLALSPRWHVYNMLGGAVMLSIESGPQAFRHLARARKAVRDAQGGRELVDPKTGRAIPPDAVQGGMVSVPEDVIAWTRDAKIGDKVSAALNFKSGQFARRLFDQARDSRLRKLGSSLVEKSYSFNGMVDDMYRTMAYLEGYDKAITKGLSPEQAASRGTALARKILANWDEMTPIERSVMRYWFPFYGFNSFLLRYVSKYPLDHPVRASIVASIARNELEDHGDGLPLDFAAMFDVTGIASKVGLGTAEGSSKMLNLRAVNPFSDVADWFKVAGFLAGEGDLSAVTSNINPALGLVLEAIGVDTRTGSAQLFPDVRVDPETGKLVAAPQGGSLAGNAISQFIPQSRVVTAMLGFSGEFKAILENNPDAAGRYLASSMGLPVMLRDVDLPKEMMQAEVMRQEEQSRAKSDALRTGNFGLLREYPGLREYADVLEELDAQGLLDDWKPPASTHSTNPLAVLAGGLG